jgi:hypothetical protein
MHAPPKAHARPITPAFRKIQATPQTFHYKKTGD